MENYWYIVQEKNTGYFLSRPTSESLIQSHPCLGTDWQSQYCIKFNKQEDAEALAAKEQKYNDEMRSFWIGETHKPPKFDFTTRRIKITYTLE